MHRPAVKYGGPAGIRTLNQGIHCYPRFPVGVDYLFTLAHSKERRSGAGRSCLFLRALGFPQPPGSLCTVRRCTAG